MSKTPKFPTKAEYKAALRIVALGLAEDFANQEVEMYDEQLVEAKGDQAEGIDCDRPELPTAEDVVQAMYDSITGDKWMAEQMCEAIGAGGLTLIKRHIATNRKG